MTYHVESMTNDTGTVLYRYTCDTCGHSCDWQYMTIETMRAMAQTHIVSCALREFGRAAEAMGLYD